VTWKHVFTGMEMADGIQALRSQAPDRLNWFYAWQDSLDNGSDPAVALDPNGDFLIAFQVFSLSTLQFDIKAHRYNDAGVSQHSPPPDGAEIIDVATDGGQNEIRPTVAADACGNF